MKKTITFIICAAAVLSLTACKNGNESSSSDASSSSQSRIPQNTSTTADTSSSAVSGSSSNSAAESAAQSAPQGQTQSSDVTSSQPEENSKPQAFYTFKREDDGVEILGGGDEGTTITVPSQINGMNVVSISGNARKTLFPNAREITLPETLREIDGYAFAGCSELKSIIIPARVEDIGKYAFQNCKSLSSIKFSEGLKEIGTGAFVGCTSLTKIDLPDSMRELSQNAFDYNVAFTVTYKGKSYTPANIGDLYALLRD